MRELLNTLRATAEMLHDSLLYMNKSTTDIDSEVDINMLNKSGDRICFPVLNITEEHPFLAARFL